MMEICKEQNIERMQKIQSSQRELIDMQKLHPNRFAKIAFALICKNFAKKSACIHI